MTMQMADTSNRERNTRVTCSRSAAERTPKRRNLYHRNHLGCFFNRSTIPGAKSVNSSSFVCGRRVSKGVSNYVQKSSQNHPDFRPSGEYRVLQPVRKPNSGLRLPWIMGHVRGFVIGSEKRAPGFVTARREESHLQVVPVGVSPVSRSRKRWKAAPVITGRFLPRFAELGRRFQKCLGVRTPELFCYGVLGWLIAFFWPLSLLAWSSNVPALSRAWGAEGVEVAGGQRVIRSQPGAGSPVADQPYFDLESYLNNGPVDRGPWHWQVMPTDLIYKSYLAGMEEPRSGTTLTYIRDDGWLWEGVLGTRIGLLRYGNQDPLFPQGLQLDVEGAADVRLDLESNVDVRAADYRVGVPLTYGHGSHQTKLAYYHMSSHLGDEFLLAHPGFQRLNWARDTIVLGHAVNLTEEIRVYAEAGWAFYTDVSEPWEFQFGLDWAPNRPTGYRGAPFFATNVHLREEVDFSGKLSVMTGWAWLSDRDRRLARMGVHYHNGKSSQNSFFNEFEEQIGAGFWYDF